MKDYAYGVRLHNRLIAASDDPLQLLAAAKTVEQQLQSMPAWAIYTKTAMASFTRAIPAFDQHRSDSAHHASRLATKVFSA